MKLKKLISITLLMCCSTIASAESVHTLNYHSGSLKAQLRNGSSVAVQVFDTRDSSSGSPVALTSGNVANSQSLSVPAGTWDIYGFIGYNHGTAGIADLLQSSLSTTSATADTTLSRFVSYAAPAGTNALDLGRTTTHQTVGPARFVFTSTTTVYLTARAILVSGNAQATGRIVAHKVSN